MLLRPSSRGSSRFDRLNASQLSRGRTEDPRSDKGRDGTCPESENDSGFGVSFISMLTRHPFRLARSSSGKVRPQFSQQRLQYRTMAVCFIRTVTAHREIRLVGESGQ